MKANPLKINTIHHELQNAARLIAAVDKLLIVTGAGMGVDSGLPDFRGNQGFWRSYPALGRSRIDFYSIASPDSFRKRPELAWGFYGHRLNLYRSTAPHSGYDILKRWGEDSAQGYMSFTTNVDGHFEKAGFEADQLVECHGSIHHLQCLENCSGDIWPADAFQPQVDEEHCLLRNVPPRCPHCGELARPNILMFGDAEWAEQRSVAQHRRLEAWLANAGQLLLIEIGAGTAVATARSFTEQVSLHLRAPVIRINPQDAFLPGGAYHISLPMKGLEALQHIDTLLSGSR